MNPPLAERMPDFDGLPLLAVWLRDIAKAGA